MEPERFDGLVHDALVHLHDRAYLQTHPLARLLVSRPVDGKEGARLQRLLIETIDDLKPRIDGGPGMPEWRRQRYLYLRYVEGLTHEQIVQQVGISHRQGHRDHREALNAVVSLLHPRLVSNDDRSPAEARPPGTADPAPANEHLLEAELVKLDGAAGHAPTDLVAVLNAALETVDELASQTHTQLRTTVEPGLPPVMANRDALRQALLNLLSYALERHAGRVIEARVAGEAERVSLTLADPTVTHPRHSTDLEIGADPRLRAGGRLVELQGGSLELPFDFAAQPGLIARLRLPAAKPASLLLVDDDPDFAQLVQRYLRGYPYRVLVATNARRAIELAETADVQIVVLDVLMPTQDGWEILRALRRLPRTRDVPVVVCSVLADRALARSLGATSLLAKPVSQRSLVDALRDGLTAPTGSPGSPAGNAPSLQPSNRPPGSPD